jgi:hypothetical protein
MDSNRKRSFWWLAALLAPYIGFGFGILLAFHVPLDSSDWLGGAAMRRLFIPTIIGILLCIVFTAVSFGHREKNASWSLLGFFGPLMVILYLYASNAHT